MPKMLDQEAAFERLERVGRLWLRLVARRASYEQRGQPAPLYIETRLWCATSHVLLLSVQIKMAGDEAPLPVEFLSFLATSIHSALQGRWCTELAT